MPSKPSEANEEKSLYYRARKACAARDTRFNNLDTASGLVFIERSRLLNIENLKIVPKPDEVRLMANAYKAPELRNYYCSAQCPLGTGNIPELLSDNIDRITVGLFTAMRELNQREDTIYRVLADGKVSPQEERDFKAILETLDKIIVSAGSLKLWSEKNL